MKILPVCEPDLPEILTLQRAAFAAEAALVNNWNIPPLTQTLEELAADWRAGIMLKALNEQGTLIGTVRGQMAHDGFYIGKLAVLPVWQGRGCGSALLEAIMAGAGASRFVLFTSTQSERNVRLYQRHGFSPFKTGTTATGVALVWMECNNTSSEQT